MQAPAAAVEYARRQAQRGTPLTALLRAYRLGHTRVLDWLLRELARQVDDAHLLTTGDVLGGVDNITEQHARLRETLLVFLQSGGSYKAAAELLTLHKNTVQYRIRKAGGKPRPAGEEGRRGRRRGPPRRGTRAAG